MNHREKQRITDLFLKSRNYDGLEFFNLSAEMDLSDWNNIRDKDWYFKSKNQKLGIMQRYLRERRYGK